MERGKSARGRRPGRNERTKADFFAFLSLSVVLKRNKGLAYTQFRTTLTKAEARWAPGQSWTGIRDWPKSIGGGGWWAGAERGWVISF